MSKLRFLLGSVLVLSHSAVFARLAAASAPQGHFVAAADTVLDAATQLTWQRRLSVATYTFPQAEQYCAGLDLEGTGWRLPTVKELLTLVDETQTMPAIDTHVFPSTPTEFFWSSSKPLAVATPAMATASAVSFRFGFDGVFALDIPQHVRCVRSK